MQRTGILISSVAVIMAAVCGPATAGGLFTDWLFYETWDSFDWNYCADNPPGSAFKVDDDSNLVVDTYGTPRDVKAEKQLECAISPHSDFVFEAHLIVQTDPTNGTGMIACDLLTDQDELVARINWYDWQASANYGSIDLKSEGYNQIYRSEPLGFSDEFATIDHVVRMVRIGDEWSAWVDEKRGATLVQEPTLTAAKVRIWVNGDEPPWIPREVEVDYIKIINSPLFGDSDCSGMIDIDDPVYLIFHIFAGGPAPCGCSMY